MKVVLEMHGVYASAGEKQSWVKVCDLGKSVQLLAESYNPPALTPAEARHLARKLYRLARLIEARGNGAP